MLEKKKLALLDVISPRLRRTQEMFNTAELEFLYRTNLIMKPTVNDLN